MGRGRGRVRTAFAVQHDAESGMVYRSRCHFGERQWTFSVVVYNVCIELSGAPCPWNLRWYLHRYFKGFAAYGAGVLYSSGIVVVENIGPRSHIVGRHAFWTVQRCSAERELNCSRCIPNCSLFQEECLLCIYSQRYKTFGPTLH